MNDAQARDYVEALEARAERMRVPYAEGRSICWRSFGRGEPLVLVHGGHGSWLHWVRNIEALEDGRRLLLPDLPGFGASDAPPEGCTLEMLADALAASLDTLLGSAPPVDMAGFSLGAVVCAHTAVRRGKVRRLALVGSPGTGTPRRPRAEMIRWRHADTPAQNQALRHNLLAHMLHADSKADALAFRSYVDGVKAIRYRSEGSGNRSSLQRILASYREPVLFVYGEHDVTGTPSEAQERLADPVLQREFRLIAGGGHWIQFECAEAVNVELRRWFETNAP